MTVNNHLQWTGLLLLTGIIIFSSATIAAEPFEQETAVGLYKAIAQHSVQYRWINFIAAGGFITLLIGFALLTRLVHPSHQRISNVGLTLLGLAAVLWIIEVIVRLTATVSIAQRVATGSAPSILFPDTIGVGLEPLFLAFLGTALAGMAALIWSFRGTDFLSSRLALIGAIIVIISGSIAAITYPWVGGVERALFYPLLFVALPLAIILLIHSRRHPSPRFG